jgi:putative ABC transport system ATP-binding protein
MALAEAEKVATVVSAHEVTRRYGEGDTAVDALRGVDLEIEGEKLTAVMGPSGSGKSTLMHILAALDAPQRGRGAPVRVATRGSRACA